eukprot:SAG31_NODE_151_length_22216_cov_37.572139_21_plen_184_part_00
MATPPSQLAGEALHGEALASARHYPAGGGGGGPPWHQQSPITRAPPDMPYGRKPSAPNRSAFRRPDIEHFCREGYVVLSDFYPPEEVSAMRAATAEALARLGKERQGAGGSADMFYGDVAFAPVDGPADAPNPYRVGYVNDLHLHQPELTPTKAHSKMLSCLTELLGPDIDGWQVTITHIYYW